MLLRPSYHYKLEKSRERRCDRGREQCGNVEKDMQKKAETKQWPKAAQEMFTKGVEKLERMHPSTPDYSVTYNHLDLMLDLP